jgi:hypothetical protein
MSPTSEFMAEVSLAHSYPELFQVTGPLPSGENGRDRRIEHFIGENEHFF